MKFIVRSSKFKVILFISGYFLLLTTLGCDAFVRKFTRKPKKENLPHEELVLFPQEYKSTLTKEEQYRQYLLYWKSWQDELIEALLRAASQKKQLSCVKEALKNLEQLKKLLNEKKSQELEILIGQLRELRDEINKDAYGANSHSNRQTAEKLKRNILRDFSYQKVKDFLV